MSELLCRLRAALICLALVPAAAQAQAYPERPVKIIVPSAPAGGFDFVGRIVGEKLAARLGGNFFIENLTGAGTLVGTRTAAKAEPDGYTLLIGGLSNLVLNVGLYPKLGYEPLKDFVPIGLIYSVPYVLAARADIPFNTVKDVVDAARAAPDKLTVATAGNGTGQDVLATAFLHLSDTNIRKVAYRGSTFVYPDLITGRVDLYFDTLQTVLPHAQAGTVKIIATTGAQRSKALPNVPTTAEAGLPELTLEQGSWFGLFAPASTPIPALQKLQAAFADVAADPEVKQKFQTGGGEAILMTGQDAEAFIGRETDKWVRIMKSAGMKAE